MKHTLRLAALLLLLALSVAVLRQGVSAQSASDEAPGHQASGALDVGWPRKVTSDGNTITVYQPQIEKWEGNRLQARAAVSVETQATPQPTFGVIWITARADVDRESRQVMLDDFQITKANFPGADDKSKDYLAVLRKSVPDAAQALSLDRLQANLAVTQAEGKTEKLPLKNEPPQILFSTKPAVLVLIDGKPAMREVQGTKLLRAINTRALILLDETSGKYYLHLMDRWMEAKAVEGPWSPAQDPPAALDAAKKSLADNPQVDLLDDPAPDLKEELEEGKVPAVYVSTVPAELIETQGEPQLSPIDGTKLLWVTNTSSEVILDINSQNYYVLLSGRWFRTKSLAKGPWEYVAGDKLPADIAKIPDTHPKGDVLASVAGTTQSKEAVIANSIPQTATVKRSEAKLTTAYDGDPKFEAIEDTKLQYAVNTATPVIRVDAKTYYAVENGVWFTAAAPDGPWTVAGSVPAAIYTIPPSSPLYYVTNVYTYAATPEVVYVGYTPGYYGTCVAPYGCVVYGTGWRYTPWVGKVWYGRPWSYGYAAGFRWTASGGWGFGFAAGAGRPWWGPVGWSGVKGGVWREGWHTGWGGRYTNVHATNVNVNNFNCYNRWNKNVVANRQTNIVNKPTNVTVNNRGNTTISNRQLNNVYANNDGNVFRRNNENWEMNNNRTWQRFDQNSLGADRRQEFDNINRQLNNELAGRRMGETNYNGFHSAGGFGGYNGFQGSRGSFGGYRGGGGFRRR